jgi:hypothetical protein
LGVLGVPPLMGETRHAATCAKDPASRACGTCRHDYRHDDGPGVESGCMKGVRSDHEHCIWACPEWEPRSQFVTHLVDVVVANA